MHVVERANLEYYINNKCRSDIIFKYVLFFRADDTTDKESEVVHKKVIFEKFSLLLRLTVINPLFVVIRAHSESKSNDWALSLSIFQCSVKK